MCKAQLFDSEVYPKQEHLSCDSTHVKLSSLYHILICFRILGHGLAQPGEAVRAAVHVGEAAAAERLLVPVTLKPREAEREVARDEGRWHYAAPQGYLGLLLQRPGWWHRRERAARGCWHRHVGYFSPAAALRTCALA